LQILKTGVEGSKRKAVRILRRENGVYSIPMSQTHGSEQTDETSYSANNRVARCQERTVTMWRGAANCAKNCKWRKTIKGKWNCGFFSSLSNTLCLREWRVPETKGIGRESERAVEYNVSRYLMQRILICRALDTGDSTRAECSSWNKVILLLVQQ
jgi:hypothetical protein